MRKNPFGWVEIPVLDLERAEKFYADYFGVSFDRQPESNGYIMSFFPMDMKDYGAGGTLVKGKDYVPSHEGVLVYFMAPAETVEKALEKAEKLGIRVRVPKLAVGEHGFIAILDDSEGNSFGIHAMK